MTGDTWHNLSAAAILSLQALREDLLEPTREEARLLREDLFGGAGGGVIGATKATFTYSLSTISLSADVDGVTGDGRRLFLDASNAEWTSIPFANSGATTYYVGAQFNEVPTRAVTGLGGVIVYEAVEEVIGTKGIPDLVTDNGDGTITFRISTLVSPVWTVADTRPVVVWLVDPVTASAEAIYEGTAEASGGQVIVTTTHALGQTSISTTAGNYFVLVKGPKITTSNISTNPSYYFLGTVISTVFSNAAQSRFLPITLLPDLFDVDHDLVTGQHDYVRATRLDVSGATGISLTGNGGLSFVGSGGIVLFGAGNLVMGTGDIENWGGVFSGAPTLTGLPAYTYVSAITLTEDFAPRSGGWATLDPATATLVYVDGTPSYVQSSSNTAAVTIRRPFTFWPCSDHGERPEIVSVRLRYKRNSSGAGDSVTLSVKRQLRDGSGAVATVATTTPAQTGASFATSTLAVAHAVDEDYGYWVELTIDPGAAAADAAVADVIVTLEKLAVE